MPESNYCVIIPVYNNVKTIANVINQCQKYINHVIVINDGSTDGTAEKIPKEDIISHHFESNQGKGSAIKKGFTIANENNFDYAITIDADGQHYPSDIPNFISESKKYPQSIIIGKRIFNENVTRATKVGLFFSNLFISLLTLQKTEDTQCGYRLYPLKLMNKIKLTHNTYDFEAEVIVKSCWRTCKIKYIPINVHYDKPEDRISHFQMKRDGWRGVRLFTKLIFQSIYRIPLYLIKYYYRKIFHAQ